MPNFATARLLITNSPGVSIAGIVSLPFGLNSEPVATPKRPSTPPSLLCSTVVAQLFQLFIDRLEALSKRFQPCLAGESVRSLR